MDTNPFQVGDKVISTLKPSGSIPPMVRAYEEQTVMTIVDIGKNNCFCSCEHFMTSFVYNYEHLVPANQPQMKQLMATGQITAQQFLDYSEKLNQKEA